MLPRPRFLYPAGIMSDLLFRCSNCDKDLAVSMASMGKKFSCPRCKIKVTAPECKMVLPCDCPACGSGLFAVKELAGESLQCPNCAAQVLVPSSEPKVLKPTAEASSSPSPPPTPLRARGWKRLIKPASVAAVLILLVALAVHAYNAQIMKAYSNALQAAEKTTDPDEAIYVLEKVIATYPRAKAAEYARGKKEEAERKRDRMARAAADLASARDQAEHRAEAEASSNALARPQSDQPLRPPEPVAGNTDTNDPLYILRMKYQEQTAKTEAKYAEQLIKVPDSYIGALSALAQALAKKGDREGVIVAREERERYHAAKTIPVEALVTSPAELRALQERCKAVPSAIEAEKKKELARLVSAYLAKLEQLRKSLAQDAKADEAALVRAEIERVSPGGMATAHPPAGAKKDRRVPPATAPEPSPSPRPPGKKFEVEITM